jgi:hypothetical protein
VRLEGLGQLKKIHLIGTRTHGLPAFGIVPQPTTLPAIVLYTNKTQGALEALKGKLNKLKYIHINGKTA